MRQKKQPTHKIPLIKKNKFEPIYVVYIIIAIICITAIGFGVYMQFYKDENIGVILGLVKEEKGETIEYKENFLNLFNNSIVTLKEYNGEVKKIKKDEDIIVVTEHVQEQNEHYSFDIEVPYFNISSNIAIKLNNEINDTFKGKYKSIEKDENLDDMTIFNVKYKAYIYDNILSLVVMSELKEGVSNQRIIVKSYNYNMDKDEECNIDQILNIKEIDSKYADKKIKEGIKESQEQNIKMVELGYNVNVRNSEDEIYDIKNAKDYFIGEDGYIFVVYAYGNTEFTSELDVIIL